MIDKEYILRSGLLDQYALGLTDEAECEVVEQCLLQYPELRKRIELIQQTMENIALQYNIKPKKSLERRQTNRSDLRRFKHGWDVRQTYTGLSNKGFGGGWLASLAALFSTWN